MKRRVAGRPGIPRQQRGGLRRRRPQSERRLRPAERHTEIVVGHGIRIQIVEHARNLHARERGEHTVRAALRDGELAAQQCGDGIPILPLDVQGDEARQGGEAAPLLVGES